uniref:DeoR/GlpR family DNA-binding transcription regulator n=1 Tax=Ndongobacter massiliensis TaxID=1871025 RepID=UPI0009300827|nr:DeoR/GlpR family DNA-binding transcription regulator [Ndongobacter massiliensis]
MLKDERLHQIIHLVNENKMMRTDEIAQVIGASLATVRRDLNALDEAGRVKKIFGGVKSVAPADYITTEEEMGTKIQRHMREKIAMAQLAATFVQDHDFVYMDAGTSVEAMIGFIQAKGLTFVTNSLTTAKELSAMKQRVYTLPGEIKLATDSIIGISAAEYLRRFNFTVGFFGANGVHKERGFTTPDLNEAMVKSAALEQCRTAYILADQSKFGRVSQVTFCRDQAICVIRDCRGPEGNLSAEVVRLEELV